MDLDSARSILKQNPSLTCVFCKGEICLSDRARGVSPLLSFLDTYGTGEGFSCADRVVGKGAALLYCLLGVAAVHAEVISDRAAEVFERRGIPYTYHKRVERILNRARDGFCPIESAVEDIDDPIMALPVIRSTLKALSNGAATSLS